LLGRTQQANQKLSPEFEKLVDKAPPWIKRKTAADKLYGRGTSDLPMPAASKVTFDDD
jgi:hypothetical protein